MSRSNGPKVPPYTAHPNGGGPSGGPNHRGTAPQAQPHGQPPSPAQGWPAQGWPQHDPYAQPYQNPAPATQRPVSPGQPHQHTAPPPSPYGPGGYPQPNYPQGPHSGYPQPPYPGQPAYPPAYPPQAGYAPPPATAGGYPADPTTGRPARIQAPQPQRAPQLGIPPAGLSALQDTYAQREPTSRDPSSREPVTGRPQSFGANHAYVPAAPPAPANPYGQPAGHYGATGAYVPAPTTARPTADRRLGAPSAYDAPPTGRPGSQRQISAYDPHPDPRGFDLGTYMPSPETTGRHTTPPTGRPGGFDQDYANGYTTDGTALATVPQGQAIEPLHDDEYDDEHDDHDDRAARKPRYLVIAASLVLAISVGGGLAYAYKTVFGPAPRVASATPVVKNGQQPVKIKPADPGGAKFANADSKVMEQLSGNADNGPKTVRTQTIARDGNVVTETGAVTVTPPPPAQSPLAVAANSATAQPIPGMTVVLPPSRPSAPLPAASPPPAAAAPAGTPLKPSKLATALPPASEPEVALDKRPAPPVKKVAVAPSGVGASGVSASAVGNGYVAVLASVPASGTSRVVALQQFADLEQKYGEVLKGKAPDVVEAQVQNKGTYHRLVVGPPASREAANTVCTQLKAAGYTSACWVTAF